MRILIFSTTFVWNA